MEMSQRATVSSGWIISIFILLTVHTLSTSSAAEEVSNNIYSKLKIKPISISNSDSSEHTHSTDGRLEVSQIKSAQLENPHTSETEPNTLNDNSDHSSSQLDLREIESLNSLLPNLTLLMNEVAEMYSSKMIKFQTGMCGMSTSSRLVTLDSGKQLCCALRQNAHALQGELYSFYLGQLLGLSNHLSPTVPLQVLYHEDRFQDVLSELVRAKWTHGQTIVCSHYIKNLQDVVLPQHLQHLIEWRINEENGTVDTYWIEQDYTKRDQWSELIAFDYLTGNTDRLVNLLTNYQYNRDIVSSPVHNLAQNGNGDLIFLDHETSFLVGYKFSKDHKESKAFQEFFMRNICPYSPALIRKVSPFCCHPSTVGLAVSQLFKSVDPKGWRTVTDLPPTLLEELSLRTEKFCGHLVTECRTSLT